MNNNLRLIINNDNNKKFEDKHFFEKGELMGKKAVMGALTLYLDFINLFIMLLRLFGQRR